MRFKKILAEFRYVGVDATCGDQSWNYANIDILASVDRLLIRKERCDVVLCIEVLEHAPEPDIVLRELFRVLKPGGLLILSTPQGWGLHPAPHDYYRFTCYDLTDLLHVRTMTAPYVYSIEKAGRCFGDEPADDLAKFMRETVAEMEGAVHE